MTFPCSFFCSVRWKLTLSADKLKDHSSFLSVFMGLGLGIHSDFVVFFLRSHNKSQYWLKTINVSRSQKWLLFPHIDLLRASSFHHTCVSKVNVSMEETCPIRSLPAPPCSLSNNPGLWQMVSALSTLSPTKSSHFNHETWIKCMQQLVCGEKWGFWDSWEWRSEFELHLNQRWRLSYLKKNLPQGIKRKLMINKYGLFSFSFLCSFISKLSSKRSVTCDHQGNQMKGRAPGPSSLISVAAIPRRQGKQALGFCFLCVFSQQCAPVITIVKKNNLLAEGANRTRQRASPCRLQRRKISKS